MFAPCHDHEPCYANGRIDTSCELTQPSLSAFPHSCTLATELVPSSHNSLLPRLTERTVRRPLCQPSRLLLYPRILLQAEKRSEGRPDERLSFPFNSVSYLIEFVSQKKYLQILKLKFCQENANMYDCSMRVAEAATHVTRS